MAAENTVPSKPSIGSKQEALDHLSNALGVIDCLFTLNSTGDIESLCNNTLDSVLNVAMRSIKEASRLISEEGVSA